MPIKNWKTNPANNTANPPFGAPEGMNPPTLNNVMRQIMADVRAHAENGGFFDYGDKVTYVANNKFSVKGDRRATYHVGRIVRGTLTGSKPVSKIVKSGLVGSNTQVEIQDTSLDNTLASVELGLDETIVGLKTGLDGLCTAKSSNNGNTIVLVPFTGTMPTTFPKGSVYRFFADADNTGATTVNGQKVKFNGAELQKNFIKDDTEVTIIYNGTDFDLINRVQTPTKVEIVITKDTKLYTTSVPSGKTAITTATIETAVDYKMDATDKAVQMPSNKEFKIELYGAGQGGGKAKSDYGSGGAQDGAEGGDSYISGHDGQQLISNVITANGGATNLKANSGGFIEPYGGAKGGQSTSVNLWADPHHSIPATGKNGANGQKVTTSMTLYDGADVDVRLASGGAGVSPSPKGDDAYLVLSYYI